MYTHIPSSTATLALASAKPNPARTINIKLPCTHTVRV